MCALLYCMHSLMKIPVKKLKNGFEMPVFGLGTWGMGGKHERNPGNDDAADIAAIERAIESGITHIDAAEAYAAGHTETLVGKAIKDRDRSKLFLASKVQAENLAYEAIIESCKKSLERLGTNYLDLYLLHRFNPNIPLKESIKALDDLVAEGFVKNIGVSNFTKEHLEEAQSYTKNKIVCNQVHYNLKFREPEATGLLEYCQKSDVFLVAWRPLGKGSLVEHLPPVLKEICGKYGKTPAQIVINWLISQDHVLTLSKMRDSLHLKENLGALDWRMDNDDIERFRKEYPDQQTISDTVPLG